MILSLKKISNILTIVILLITNALQAQTPENLSAKRKDIEIQIQESMNNEDFQEAITNLRKLAETDKDTLLIAAAAYQRMKFIYEYNLNDSNGKRIAEGMESYLVNKSLEKYPDNMDGYIYKLNQYKYAENKEGEAALIQQCLAKFSNRWEMNFVLGYHYIYNDFLWPEAPEFDVSSKYFKKVLVLNPSEFNTLLLLSVAYEKNKIEREDYLKKMYQLNPSQFKKNDSENKNKYPYQVTSVGSSLLGRDLFMFLTKKECELLKLIH